MSNEVGMGIVPMSALARSYRDVIGRVNAIWAEAADDACLPSPGACCGWSEHERRAGSRARGDRASPTPPRARRCSGASTRRRSRGARWAGSSAWPCRSRASSARLMPSLGRPVVVVCAADHGVAAEGVSAYPSSVTAQMVANYAAGGAAVSVLARRAGARLVVVDCGVAEPLPVPGVLDRRLGAGTASMLRGPAMSRELAVAALETGIAARRPSCSTAPAASRSARWASATPLRRPRSAVRSRARLRTRPAVAAPASTTRGSRASATS